MFLAAVVAIRVVVLGLLGEIFVSIICRDMQLSFIYAFTETFDSRPQCPRRTAPHQHLHKG
jgi:hypothetical protein